MLIIRRSKLYYTASGIIRSDFQTQFCRTDIFKKSVFNLGTKLYNKLPNYITDLENLKPFKKQLKAFLLQQTFYSVDEYLSHVQAL